MKYLKTYEGSSNDYAELTNKLIDKLIDFIQKVYPTVKIKVSNNYDGHSFGSRYKIKINTREILPKKLSDNFTYIEIKKSMFNITIYFPIRYTEKYFLKELNEYLIPIFKKYQTNHDHKYIFTIKYNNIQKIVDEISNEDYDIYHQTNKYNI